jgi:HTH-type transcriptional regulator/antitoxin HipB
MQKKIISPESLGFALREERKKKGLNQTELGIPVGVDQTTVSKVEQGKPGTRLDTLFRLLSVLDLELILQPKDVSSSTTSKEDW